MPANYASAGCQGYSVYSAVSRAVSGPSSRATRRSDASIRAEMPPAVTILPASHGAAVAQDGRGASRNESSYLAAGASQENLIHHSNPKADRPLKNSDSSSGESLAT